MNRPVIGFAGLTHLGLNSAVATAVKGFRVMGFHNDASLVALLNSGKPHVMEPQLPELMEKYQDQAGINWKLEKA